MCLVLRCVFVTLLDIILFYCFFFFKQKTAYEMRISDWSSDVCSSDLRSGELTTGFIAEEYPEGFTGADTGADVERALAAIAGFMASAEADRARRVDGQQIGRAHV